MATLTEAVQQDPQVRQAKRKLAQAEHAALLTAKAGLGQLVESVERDYAGRKIVRFWGDPEACWGAFKLPVKRVVGWGVK